MKRKLQLIHLACLCVFWEVECMCTCMEKPEVNIVFWKPFLHFIFWRQFVFWNLDLIILAQPRSLFGLLEILRDPSVSVSLTGIICIYKNSDPYYVGMVCSKPFPLETSTSLISFNSPLASTFIYDLMFAWLLGKTIGIFAEHHKTSVSSNPEAKMR